MKVAIIGAGLAGLATAHYLLDAEASVHLFDAKGIGGGASGMACGLIHPYPGEEGRRSFRADEALLFAKELFARAGEILQEGILRVPRTEEERKRLREAFLTYEDVEERAEGFFIKSGMTLHVGGYLEKLWRLCEARGAKLIIRRIENLEELAEYDQVVIAAGAGSCLFSACNDLRVQKVKGQLLLCSYPSTLPPLPYSLVGKGYVAPQDRASCILGATYERGFTTEEPEMEKAKAEILPKIYTFFPQARDLLVHGCRAGVRLARVGHYLPYVQKVGEKTWVLTALGSRGLLYHALAAKSLVEAIIDER